MDCSFISPRWTFFDRGRKGHGRAGRRAGAPGERRTHAFNFQLVGFSLHRLGEAVERGIHAHTHRAARLNLQMVDEALRKRSRSTAAGEARAPIEMAQWLIPLSCVHSSAEKLCSKTGLLSVSTKMATFEPAPPARKVSIVTASRAARSLGKVIWA